MIAERFRELRLSEGLSQEEFGKRIGASRSMISNIEYGKVEAKEYLIKLVCKEFNISEKWLRTGEGEMIKEDTELYQSIVELIENESPTLKETAFLLTKLNEDQLQSILNLVKSFDKKSTQD